MADREKVVKGLEMCIADEYCNGCPYEVQCDSPGQEYAESMMRDALELLKEQEPKQIINITDSIEGMEVGYCPSCDRAIVNKKIDETKFCRFCGQAVKWE